MSNLEALSRIELINLITAQQAQIDQIQRRQEVTNKQVYTAIRNYVANELGLGNDEIRQMINAAVMKAVERIVAGNSTSVTERVTKRVEDTITRAVQDEVRRQVETYMRHKMPSQMRITVELS